MMRYERTSPVRHPGRIALVVVLLVVVLGTLLLQKGVFVLRNVRVEGTTRYTADQVFVRTGLSLGQSVFAIKEEEISAALQKDRYLMLDSTDLLWPDTLILRVRERQAKVALTRLGRLVLLDEINCVMDITNQLETNLELLLVTGMDVVVAEVGMPLQTKAASQLVAMDEVLKELQLQAVIARVSELNVSNLDNLYLVTKEGMKVELGDTALLEQKIALMRGTLDKLRENGMYAGTLDVSAAAFADYQEVADYTVNYTPDVTPIPTER